MKRIIIELLVSILIFSAGAETPLAVLPENAALLTMTPGDYPTENESFCDDAELYAILLDPSALDPHAESCFRPDLPRRSLIYARLNRKLPKSPLITARDADKIEQDRMIFEKMFSAYLSSGNSMQNKRWILAHGSDVLELQANGYQWDDPLMFYSFNALFNSEMFSLLHAGNARGTLRRSHIPSPLIILVGETEGKKIIFDWKLIAPFHFYLEGLPAPGEQATRKDGWIGYICDEVFPSLYIENTGDPKRERSDIWLWRLDVHLYDRSILMEEAILLLKESP